MKDNEDILFENYERWYKEIFKDFILEEQNIVIGFINDEEFKHTSGWLCLGVATVNGCNTPNDFKIRLFRIKTTCLKVLEEKLSDIKDYKGKIRFLEYLEIKINELENIIEYDQAYGKQYYKVFKNYKLKEETILFIESLISMSRNSKHFELCKFYFEVTNYANELTDIIKDIRYDITELIKNIQTEAQNEKKKTEMKSLRASLKTL